MFVSDVGVFMGDVGEFVGDAEVIHPLLLKGCPCGCNTEKTNNKQQENH